MDDKNASSGRNSEFSKPAIQKSDFLPPQPKHETPVANVANSANSASQDQAALIQSSVAAAVAEAMKPILAALNGNPRYSTQSSSSEPGAPLEAPLPAPAYNPVVPPAFTGKSFVGSLKGIPVQEGQDLRHVHPATIQAWFAGVENRWKEQFNKRKLGGAPVAMSWTRG